MVKISLFICSEQTTKIINKAINCQPLSISHKKYKIIGSDPINETNKTVLSSLKSTWRSPYFYFVIILILLIPLSLVLYFKCPTVLPFCVCTMVKHYKLTSHVKIANHLHGNCTDRDDDKFDCHPQPNPTYETCIMRGCCWSFSKRSSSGIPRCFYPKNFRSYEYTNIAATDIGAVAHLDIRVTAPYPKNILKLRVDFNYRTEDIVEVKIYDRNATRYETPLPELPQMGRSAAKNTKYVVDIDKNKFGFKIVRKSNNETIFNAQDVGGFIFCDQLLQLSARLPSNNLYGLGQQRNNFLLDLNWTKITLFNHDQIPKDGTNLYGSHPFYLAMEKEGLSNGVLLLNSNAMDIELSPAPAITYRTIGGVLDFFFFLGPSPSDVLKQYTQLVGRPFLPPYWSLGFHLCRFGYKTLTDTIEVWNRTRNAGIPFDTQWNDLDYMEENKDFTYDKERFSGLPEFVDLLHQTGMHYVVLVDPGISAGELPGTYSPYSDGISQHIFVSDVSGYRPFVGKVWNKKSTVFVDFLKPAAVSYWLEQLRLMHKMFSYDGAWIVMNDPSNFLDGTINGCQNTSLDFPPYLPDVAGQKLFYRTLCMSAKHGEGLYHYDMHNIYGFSEAIVTSFAMQQIRNKRAFVISRSSFSGLGHYAGVWTGDITSTWDDMAHSVSDILSFSLFGIPMSGVDICGFNGNTTVALCQRWSQLGAFYPFSRNHNSINNIDQDPVALGPEVVKAARDSLLIRYSLLPYLYTLFWHAYKGGETVARPMFIEFPNDTKTYPLNAQFLWGSALLIAPVLEEGVLEVEVYLPAGRWYDFFSNQTINSTGSVHVIPAPLDMIPLFLRAGFVIPSQCPELTTIESRLNPVDLIVALDDKHHAIGDLYWDDGDSLDHNSGIYNLLQFVVFNKELSSEVKKWRYTNTSLLLGNVKLLGIEQPNLVTVNGEAACYEYYANTKMLLVKDLYLDLSKKFQINWK